MLGVDRLRLEFALEPCSPAIPNFREAMSEIALASFVLERARSLVRLLLVSDKLDTVDQSEAVAVAKLASAIAVSCCNSIAVYKN